MQKSSSLSVNTPTPPAAEQSVIKSAAYMSLATLSSRILGMFRDMVMAALFPRMVSDAYVVAFRLPNLFRRILGEGSLAASFVPLYVESKNRNLEEAKLFSSAVFSMLSVLTATLSVLGVIFMEPLMARLVGGQDYMQIEGKFALTVFLAQIMFAYLFLVTTYAFYMSLANAHKIFFLPALAPAGFNFITIVMAFMPQWKMPGDQLATGVLVGGFVQLAMAAQPLLKLKVMPKFSFRWAVPNVKVFFRTVLPSMLGMSVAQLLGLLNVNFASHLPQGSHSYIYLADRLLEFPQSLLSVSLGVALLPTLSEMWVHGQRTEFLSTAQRHIRLLMVLSLPSAVGLYVLAEPIVRVIYGRGQFIESDIIPTAQVVAVYSIVLVVSGLHRVTVPCFYAIKNTWLPAANSVFCLVSHYFVARWATEQFGLQGLVGATAFTGTLNLFILLISYKIIFKKLGVISFIKSVMWLLPSLLVMAACAHWTQQHLSQALVNSMASNFAHLIALAVSLILSVIVFFGVNRLVGHPEANEIIGLLSRRLVKKSK